MRSDALWICLAQFLQATPNVALKSLSSSIYDAVSEKGPMPNSGIGPVFYSVAGNWLLRPQLSLEPDVGQLSKVFEVDDLLAARLIDVRH